MSAQDPDKLRADIVFGVRLRDLELSFRSTWGLFSPREIDAGTRLLLEHLDVARDADCLDLGCGYGALGVALARLAPEGETWLVDKDFVAVEYAKKNARQNRAANVVVRLSNGFSHVDRRFDLIVANLPAKTGKELLYLLLCDARAHLAPGGRLYVVTISGLRRFIERNMNEVFGNYRKLKQGRSHTVALAELRE
jgi:16S rRNA G1207 methylase RsmC